MEEERRSFGSGLEILEPRPLVYWGGLEERMGSLWISSRKGWSDIRTGRAVVKTHVGDRHVVLVTVSAMMFDGDCGRIEVNGSRRMTFHGLDINKGSASLGLWRRKGWHSWGVSRTAWTDAFGGMTWRILRGYILVLQYQKTFRYTLRHRLRISCIWLWCANMNFRMWCVKLAGGAVHRKFLGGCRRMRICV